MTVRIRALCVRALWATLVTFAGALLCGCVTPMPFAAEAPQLSYQVARPIVVAVLDARNEVAEGKPRTYIGVAHSAFGIPSDMQVYPWFVSDKAKKDQTLAQAIEDRVVLGLNVKGWQLVAAGSAQQPTEDERVAMLSGHNAQRLLVLTLTAWKASINLSWVGAFNFDWGYKLDVYDQQGVSVASISDSGRDVVDEKASDSPQNMLKAAFRDRLTKILDSPEVKAALSD